MKHIKLFEQFLNESSYWGPFKKVVDAVYTAKNFPGMDKQDFSWKKDDLAHALGNAGYDEKITLSKIPLSPNFAKLQDDPQNDILIATGTGRTPNSKFIKAISQQIRAFGSDRNEELSDRISNAIVIKNSMKDADWPNTYSGFPYGVRSQLRKEFGPDYEVFKKLTDQERAHLQKLLKPVYNKFVNGVLSDSNLDDYIHDELRRYHPKPNFSSYSAKNSDENRVLNSNWNQNSFKPLMNYIKKKLIDDLSSPKWETFKVEKLKSLGSEHSAVASSSFSTTYYYKAEISLDGKKFRIPKFILSSDYSSGGWN
jgi:hypothetical protein